MPKVNKPITEEPWKYDELLPILIDAFRVLYNSYIQLKSNKQGDKYCKPIDVKIWHLENIITDDLVNGTSSIIRHHKYRIQKQQWDFSSNAIIDIAILYSLKFGDNSNDIKIECKRLDNIAYIVNDGIQGFKNNKYSKNLTIAGMLLYNIQDKIPENIVKLKKSIERKYSSEEILTDFQFIDNYSYSYKSTHKRIDNTDLDLYSCAFDFSEIIQKQR